MHGMLGVSLVVQSLLGADGDRQNSSPAHHDLHQHPPSSQSMNETRFVRQTVTVCSDQDKSFETRSRVTEESHMKGHILFCSTRMNFPEEVKSLMQKAAWGCWS